MSRPVSVFPPPTTVRRRARTHRSAEHPEKNVKDSPWQRPREDRQGGTELRQGQDPDLPRAGGDRGQQGLRHRLAAQGDRQRQLDPGFVNTANTRSSVTYIDGAQGILRHRATPSRSSRSTPTSWILLAANPTASCPRVSSTRTSSTGSPRTPWCTRTSSL
ncbi:hypothetical protein QJS66_22100 [Kocuria rhizophila]|nr:hypothetical protein QJS66_22100 [Kocuria rhizophila]